MNSPRRRCPGARYGLPPLLLLLSVSLAIAGSATWNLNPTNGDWNTSENWTPMTVPNGPTDSATFNTSSITDVSLSANTEVSGISFGVGANAYSISTGDASVLTISGAGIANDSGGEENFTTEAGANSIGVIVFSNNASAGSLTTFTNAAAISYTSGSGVIVLVDNATGGDSQFINKGSGLAFQIGGFVQFSDDSSAGNGTFINEGGTIENAVGGQISFFDTTTAASATITNDGGPVNTTGNTGGGSISFNNNSTAANGTLINNGSTINGGTGGFTRFGDSSDAGNATLIANGGSGGGAGGTITFASPSTGGESRIEVFGNGALDLTVAGPVTVGSIEGDGLILLGVTETLAVGSNNLSTVFSGVIQNLGSLAKIGTGTLSLTGANTYSKGTTIEGGRLLANNRSGSGTGSGTVQVDAGVLGGRGTIAGAVTLGTGSGGGAILAPGGRGRKPVNPLTIQSALTFKSDATYRVGLDNVHAIADEVVAASVTIDSGALVSVLGFGHDTLTPGTVFTIIENTSGTPISGTFSNLADGAILNVNGNNLQASYEGGDGNDLTLTVVP